MDIRIRTLTPLWTGGVDRTCDRLHETGIIGSLRWWYEAIVRGLGGYACDPTAKEARCPQDSRKKPTDPGHHCVVCELFGCSGWARKFRLVVLDDQGNVVQQQIRASQILVFRFIPLRPVQDEEWCLVAATLRLIADYGAMGGKTVFKPSDEQNRQNALHHRDFGLIQVLEQPLPPECKRGDLQAYVQGNRWRRNFRDNDFAWASLHNFWCVKGRYLARQNHNQSLFNRVVGRHTEKNRAQKLFRNTEINQWLAGGQQESKKVFSFKEPEKARRTFGFIKPGLMNFEEIKRRLKQSWPDLKLDEELIIGERILAQLFQQEEDA